MSKRPTTENPASVAALEQRIAELERELARLRDAEDKLQFQAQILAHVDDAVVVSSADGFVTYWNSAAELLYGIPAARALGKLRDDVIHYEWLSPDDRDQCVAELLATGMWRGETRLRHPDGRVMITESSVSTIQDERGKIVGYMAATRDVTQKKEAQQQLEESRAQLERHVKQRTRKLSRAVRRLQRTEKALLESESRLRSIIDTTPAVIYVKDWDGRYMLINRTFEEIFKLPREKIEGFTDHEIFPAQWADHWRANDLHVLTTGEAVQFDEDAPHHAGTHSYVSVKFPLRDAEGKVYALCGISTDITDRRQAEQSLRDEQEFLRRLLAAHERDRRLVAYELHDGLVQEVTAAVIHLNSVARGADKLSPRHRELLESARKLVQRAMEDGRRLLSGLRPPILDELGIVMAIKYLIAEAVKESNIEIRFSADVQFDRLEPLLEVMLFRIVQEALTNIRKHSQARKAIVTLTQLEDRLRVVIHDWGVGFDRSKVPPGRLGLEAIVKRTALMGGSAQIRSEPDEGTHIEVELPVTPPPNARA